MELDLQKVREELAREGGESPKKGRRRGEVALAVEIVKRNEENMARPVTSDGGDGDLRMRDQDVTPKPARLEASQQATPAGTDNNHLIDAYFTI